jgi:hypothetical protein
MLCLGNIFSFSYLRKPALPFILSRLRSLTLLSDFRSRIAHNRKHQEQHDIFQTIFPALPVFRTPKRLPPDALGHLLRRFPADFMRMAVAVAARLERVWCFAVYTSIGFLVLASAHFSETPALVAFPQVDLPASMNHRAYVRGR